LCLCNALLHTDFHHPLVVVGVGKVRKLATVLVEEILKDARGTLQSRKGG
jgi:hypothetical protein